MPEPTAAENRRAAEILSGDINNWLGAHSDWPAAYKVIGFASSIMERIPADRRAEFADLRRRINADRGFTRTEADGLARQAMAAYISTNPNANTEDLLAAMDSNMRIANGGPATQGRNPRDYPLDNDSSSTFTSLARDAQTLAAQQIAREEESRRPVTPTPQVLSLADEMANHRTSSITIGEQFNMDNFEGSRNWGALYAHQRVVSLTNVTNDNAANGTAISANIDRNFVMKATQSNTVLVAGLNDVARNIDHSYQIGYHGQRLNVNNGDSGQVASDATVVLTITRQDMESGRIRSVNIGEDGATTVTLNDGRSVQSNNKVVFRYVSAPGTSDAQYSQMTAEQMRDWIVQDRVRNPRAYETPVTPPAPVAQQPAVQYQCAPPAQYYYSQPQYYCPPPVIHYNCR